MSARRLLAPAVVAAALALAPRAAAGAAPSRVTLAFTGDVAGYLEPCG